MKAVTLGLMVSLIIGVSAVARPPAADRNYGGGPEILEINGKTVLVSRLSGGNIVAEAVEESQGSDIFPRKHAGPSHIEPIVAEMPADALSDVLRDFLSGANKPLNGSTVTLSFDMRPVEQRQFENASISEVRFDALDANSKEL